MRRIVRGRLLIWAGLGLCLVGGRGMLAQGGQDDQAPPLPPPINQSTDPLLQRFVWRSIGPAVMGGRVDDIAVAENDPSTIYLGFATSGVWKTTNTARPGRRFSANTVSSRGDVESPFRRTSYTSQGLANTVKALVAPNLQVDGWRKEIRLFG